MTISNPYIHLRLKQHFNIVTLLLIIFSSVGLSAQTTCRLSGKVIDASNNESIIGCLITIASDKTFGTASDVEGNYTLLLPKAKHTIYFSFLGYKNDSLVLDLSNLDSLNKDVKLKTDSKLLDVVVVSEGKFDKKMEDLTVSMEVIKPALISNKNTNSIEQALEQAPGLTILDNEPQIRGGSGFTFGVGSRVALVVDGMPLLSGDAGRPEWGFIPVENIEQVEIIKGASSVLYGSSALSGVINIRTAYPRIKPKTNITFNSGVYSQPKNVTDWYDKSLPIYGGLSVFHSRIIKSNLDLVVAANYFTDQGYIGPPKVTDPGFIDTLTNFNNKQLQKMRGRINFNLRYRAPKIEGLSFGVNGNAMYSKTNFVLAWQDDSLNLYRAYPGAISLQNQSIFNLDPFIKYSSKGISHSLQTRIFHTDNVITNNQSNKATLFYGEYQMQRRWDKIPEFTFTGGVVGSAAISHANLYSGGGSPDNIIRNLSGYFQLDKKIKQIINLSGGFRYEYFKMNEIQSVVKPIFRMGASLKLTKATFLRYSYGQGFRFPTITERYISTNVGYFGVFPNSDLLPETSYNQEVGLKQGFKIKGFKGFLDIAGFYQEYNHTIEYLFGIWNPIGQQPPVGFKFMNTGNSRVRGVDVSLMGRTDENKKLQLTTLCGWTYVEPVTTTPTLIYGYDHNQNDSSQSYINSSLDTTGYLLKYRFKKTWKCDFELKYKGIAFGWSTRYYSRIQNIDKAFEFMEALSKLIPSIADIEIVDYWKNQKPVFVSDFRISYEFKKAGKFSFVMSNVFNKKYFLRPMKIESPRTTAIQYSINF